MWGTLYRALLGTGEPRQTGRGVGVQRPRSRRIALEPLEERRLLSAVVLSQNTLDSDPGWTSDTDYLVGQIRGTKWEDRNGNGARDAGEPGLAGVTIYLDLKENGLFDNGEPSAVTVVDVPATASIDETGKYELLDVPVGMYAVAEVVPDRYEATYPGTGTGGTGQLTFVSSLREGAGSNIDGLDGAYAPVSSPDGSHLYVAGQYDNGLAAFRRDAATGGLTQVQVIRDGENGVRLEGSPHRHGQPRRTSRLCRRLRGRAVAVFSRDTGTGTLTFVEMVKDGANGVDGLGAVSSLTTSADGRFVYSAARTDYSISTFSRDTVTGRLTWIETIRDNTGLVDGLFGYTSVVVSGDDAHVYVAGYYDDAVMALSHAMRRPAG